MSTISWPSSWKFRKFSSAKAKPRCRSGDVGSTPSLIRSGRPSLSFASSAPSGSTSTALRVSSEIPMRDLEWLDVVRSLEAEPLRMERERRREVTDARLEAAVPVTLAGQREVGVRSAVSFERSNDRLGLCWRHDFVVEALGDQDSGADVVRALDRRSFAVD